MRENVSPVEARELFERGALLSSSVAIGTIPTFLRTIRRAVPEIYERFAAARSHIGTAAERDAVRRIYHCNYKGASFMRDVLAKSVEGLAVVPVAASPAAPSVKNPQAPFAYRVFSEAGEFRGKSRAADVSGI